MFSVRYPEGLLQDLELQQQRVTNLRKLQQAVAKQTQEQRTFFTPSSAPHYTNKIQTQQSKTTKFHKPKHYYRKKCSKKLHQKPHWNYNKLVTAVATQARTRELKKQQQLRNKARRVSSSS
jgi:hypothetical protein